MELARVQIPNTHILLFALSESDSCSSTVCAVCLFGIFFQEAFKSFKLDDKFQVNISFRIKSEDCQNETFSPYLQNKI